MAAMFINVKGSGALLKGHEINLRGEMCLNLCCFCEIFNYSDI